MKFKPHPYQKDMLKFVLKNPKAALWVDMGLGKTVVSLTAVNELIDRCEIARVLVVAPLRVCLTTWPDEIAKWDHLRGLTSEVIRGDPEQRHYILKAPPEKAADIQLINYEMLPWLVEEFLMDYHKKHKKVPWDLVIWDESTKMKSHASVRHKIIKRYVSAFPRAITLTGTPAPQGYIDLWGQFFLLDSGERLGKCITHYRNTHFQQDWSGYNYILQSEGEHEKRINHKIRDITLCLREEDHLKMPPFRTNVVSVPMPTKLRKKYEEFEKEMWMAIDDTEVNAFNTAALTSKCRQFTSGSIYDEDRLVHSLHKEKEAALQDIVDDLQGEPCIIIYEFRHELIWLRKMFRKAPVIGGGTKDADALKAHRAWNEQKLPVLIAHPASIGHGLNFQDGGRTMIWTSGTWSLELYEQTRKRLHRQGQRRSVVSHHLVMKGTVDEAVMLAISSKGKVQGNIKRALASYRKG